MKSSAIMWLIVLGVFLAFLVLGLWLVQTTGEPTPGNCGNIKKTQPNVKWSEDCSYIEENTPDGSLKTPKEVMYLTRFTSSPAFGPPLGANVWYRYRYVRGNTGGYGQFSPWTKSPIIAGSRNLPCKGGDCSDVQKSGGDSCQSNIIQLGVDGLDYSMSSNIYANVHRVVLPSTNSSPPSNTAKSEIVGIFTPSQGKSYQIVDLSKSPCEQMLCNRPGC